jgi:hypothetical protein
VSLSAKALTATPAGAQNPDALALLLKQATAGSYESPHMAWRPSSGDYERLEVDAQLNGGVVYADVRTSSDGFATIAQEHTFKLRDGSNALSLAGLERRFGQARIRLRFVESGTGTSPLVSRLELVSTP